MNTTLCDDVLTVLHEIDRIRAEGTCKTCAYYESTHRGGRRHCVLDMRPANQDDGCEEHEQRPKNHKIGQLPLPLRQAKQG